MTSSKDMVVMAEVVSKCALDDKVISMYKISREAQCPYRDLRQALVGNH